MTHLAAFVLRKGRHGVFCESGDAGMICNPELLIAAAEAAELGKPIDWSQYPKVPHFSGLARVNC